MKNYILILFFLFSLKAFSCSCGMSNVHEKYVGFETIIKARVIKVYPNSSRENNYFKIDIETLEVFKGKELTTLMVYGSSDNIRRSSCEMFTPEESIYLIYIYKNDKGQYSLHRCSGSRRVDEEFVLEWELKTKNNLKKSLDLEFKALNFLKGNNKIYQTGFNAFSGDLRVFVKSKKGIQLNKRFAYYEITLKADLALKKVNALIEFDNEKLSKEILDCLKNEKRWVLYNDKKIDTDTTFLIGLYYYPQKEKSESFISIHSL